MCYYAYDLLSEGNHCPIKWFYRLLFIDSLIDGEQSNMITVSLIKSVTDTSDNAGGQEDNRGV